LVSPGSTVSVCKFIEKASINHHKTVLSVAAFLQAGKQKRAIAPNARLALGKFRLISLSNRLSATYVESF